MQTNAHKLKEIQTNATNNAKQMQTDVTKIQKHKNLCKKIQHK